MSPVWFPTVEQFTDPLIDAAVDDEVDPIRGPGIGWGLVRSLLDGETLKKLKPLARR